MKSCAELRLEVVGALRSEPGLDGCVVSVYALDSVAILSGYVDSPGAARLAERTAESVSGVGAVISRLTVRGVDGAHRAPRVPVAAGPSTMF